MISICLCDDSKSVLAMCKHRLTAISNENELNVKIKEFTSGESLLFYLDENLNQFDIIFMDMLMGKMNGIQTTTQMRTAGYKGIIIFLTSSKEYAIESFEVEPLCYILKDDLQGDKFEQVFLKAVAQLGKIDSKILKISNGKSSTIVIEIKDIVYVESCQRKIKIITINEVRELSCQINLILEKLETYGFIRCHKSFIVNASFITSFTKADIILKSQYILPIGRKYAEEFADKFSEHISEEIML